jgi:hypothetical protein
MPWFKNGAIAKMQKNVGFIADFYHTKNNTFLS